MDFLILLLIILIGIFTGIVAVTVGSSGLIVIPFLMNLGLNPYFAIATGKFSILSSFVSGGIKYNKEGVIKQKKLAFTLSLITIAGAIIGANLVLKISENILKVTIIIILLIVLLSMITKNNFWLKHKKILKKQKKSIKFIIMFLLGIYIGSIGVGFGSLVIFYLIYFFGFTYLESAALMTIVNFFGLIIAVIIFIANKVIDYSIGIPLLISIAIGGWIGAHFAVLKGSIWIRRLFILVTSILIIKLIFNL